MYPHMEDSLFALPRPRPRGNDRVERIAMAYVENTFGCFILCAERDMKELIVDFGGTMRTLSGHRLHVI
jgi:hypothetical protein